MKTCLRLLPLLLAAALTACAPRPGARAASLQDTPQELLSVDGEILQNDSGILTLQLSDGQSAAFSIADAAADGSLDLSAGQAVRIHFLGSLEGAGEGMPRAVRIEQGS